MSGNPMLDRQIAQAVMPRFDPMQAVQQMQRPAVQPVQNPFFGGSIPMDFGLPQASHIPAGYSNPLMQFRPSQAPITPVAPKPTAGDFFAAMMGGNMFGQQQPTTDSYDGGNQA